MIRRGTRPATGVILVAGFLWGLPCLTAAQSSEAAFTVYGMADGLSNASVNALLQDSAGFIWVGTQDGLDEFDGIRFRVFRARADDSTSLRDDYVTALAQADSGRIWVGSQQGGLQLLDPLTEEVTSYPLTELGPWLLDDAEGGSPSRLGRTVARIVVRPGRDLLLRTDVGLVRFDPSTGNAHVISPTRNDPTVRVTALGSTRDGRALLGLSDGGWARLGESGGLVRAPPTLPDSAAEVSGVADGYVAVTFDGSVYAFDLDRSSYRLVARLPKGDAARLTTRSLLVDREGMVWVATTAGAFRVDPTSGAVARVGGGEGTNALPHSVVSALLLDRTGVLWVGTWGGLASLHPLSLRIHRLMSGSDLEGAGVISIEEARPGWIWVGTDGGGVQLVATDGLGTARRPPPVSGLDRAAVFGLARGGDDTLYVAAFSDGLWRVAPDGSARKIPTFTRGGARVEATAYSVFRDHRGEIWAGTYPPLGLSRLERSSNRFVTYRGTDPGWDLGSDWIWPLAEDSQGRLWVGGYNGGLSVISSDRTTARLYRAGPGGLTGERILAVYVDSRDRVWIGTEGDGLNRLDPETGDIVSWTAENGLPHDHVEGIVEDAHGMMWISTNDGLARLDPENGEILVFREPAGLAGNRFLANAAHRGSDGTLYFGGDAGLTILDPDVIAASQNVPSVALTAFRIQGREVPLVRAERTDELVLAPDENFFAFEFAAMDFEDVSQNRYRYMLEGLDADWVDAGNTPVANYTSVPPDRYVFRVEARNSEGVWNKDALALPIRVLAPFYERWWFRSLVMVGVLSLVAGFYTYRLRQLEARQRLRLEIAGKLHDDIGANLSNIALKADMVRETSSLDDRRAAILGDVGRLARDTAHKVRETVWVVNTRYDTLPKLVGHMHDTADTLLAGHVSFSFSEPGSCPDLPLSMDFRQNVYLLFKEAINNAVKHARATRVDITVTVDQRMMTFRVVDDGAGFDARAASRGNGQQLMRTRAAGARGELAVTSVPGQGTTVEFSARVR